MRDSVLLGVQRFMFPIPGRVWRSLIARNARGVEASMGFMSAAHHLIRDFVVRELAYVGEPLTPEFIARELTLPVDEVNILLDALEKRLTFLYRNEEGAVVWAYPVTADKTPHHITFSTGERIDAA